MRRADDNPTASGTAVPWTRGALVSLWLVVFALVGGVLAVRWDALIGNLAGAHQAQQGAVRR
jgi:hypothetical protein